MSKWLWRVAWLLVPAAWAAHHYFPSQAVLAFSLACLSLMPLAKAMGDATEALAERLGPAAGSLLSLHRVREVRGGRVRLCGDACARDDGFYEPSELLGRAVAVRRAGRPLATARLGGPLGRLLGLLRPLTRAGLRVLRAERLLR